MSNSPQKHEHIDQAATLLAELLVAAIDEKYAGKATRPASEHTRKPIKRPDDK